MPDSGYRRSKDTGTAITYSSMQPARTGSIFSSAVAATTSTRPRYRDVARRKQAAREDAIRPSRGSSNMLPDGAEGYLRATGTSSCLSSISRVLVSVLTLCLVWTFAAPEIVQHISDGEWTASDVLEAYISRAILAQDLTNCLTEGQSVCGARIMS